jgi:hypothetical protein
MSCEIYAIRGSDFYITIKVRKIYNVKIEVFSFVIKSGRKLTIGVNFEVNASNENGHSTN